MLDKDLKNRLDTALQLAVNLKTFNHIQIDKIVSTLVITCLTLSNELDRVERRLERLTNENSH